MPRERTQLRYQLFRSKARTLAGVKTAQLQPALGFSGVRFDAIGAEALAAWTNWQDSYFSWDDVIVWKAKEPMALDLSIWFGDTLCGLCFANPNGSRQRIRIVRLEGRPEPDHPLKRRVASLALLAIEQYARIIGSRLIEVQEPLEGAISAYRQLGFYFDTQCRLVKEVEGLVS